MQMSADQVRLHQNPVLTNLLLGLGQGTMIAEKVFPRLPQALSKATLGQAGDAHLRNYNLRRAPGAATKRITVNYEGKTYEIDQYAVDVPIPRELIRESDNSRRFGLPGNLDITRIALVTAHAVLALDYEREAAGVATDPTLYSASHVTSLSSTAKWSADTGTPVTDVEEAAEDIRKATGRRPNTLTLSPDALVAVRHNKEVRGYLPSTQMGPATIEQLKTIFNVPEILVGDAIEKTDSGANDVWGNNAILSYVPKLSGASGDISLAEPAHGFTSVMEGHPFAEQPRYDGDAKSWIYGVTYERRVNLAYPDAAFLFQNVK